MTGLDYKNLWRIKRPLQALAFCLGLSLLILLASGWWQRQQQQLHAQTKEQLATLQAQAALASESRQTALTYQASFGQLKAQGVIGEEQRLAWVDFFRILQQQISPNPLELQIDAQRPLEDPPSLPLETMQFHASRLKINTTLPHEGDALKLLDSLNQLPGGKLPRQCMLERNAQPGQDGLSTLSFQCQLDLLTLGPITTTAATQ